jgi:hypothetical protein
MVPLLLLKKRDFKDDKERRGEKNGAWAIRGMTS